MIDQSRLVEAVAPRDVLERVLADRRPEARRDVPLRVLAGDGPARDLAHVERLAPVLDRQLPARGGVVRERHVARRVDVLGGRAHVLVDDDPPLPDVEPARLREARARLTPAAIRIRSAGVLAAAPRRCSPKPRRPRRAALDLCSSRASGCAGPPPRRAAWRAGSSSSLTRVTLRPRIASDAAASQPMKPEPTTIAVFAVSARSRSTRAVARLRSSSTHSSVAPGTGSTLGSAPVASTHAS